MFIIFNQKGSAGGGYISKVLIEEIHIGTDKTITGRMADRPYQGIWRQYSKVIAEMPNKKVKEYYRLLKTEIPTHINLKKYAAQLFG